MMDIYEIVHGLRKISEFRHAISPPKLLLNCTIADAQILIDPDMETIYPSSSRNTVAFLGTEQKITRTDASSLVDVYRAHRVKRFFVSLSPSPWLEQTITLLEAAGLSRFNGPDYHTLVRSVAEPRDANIPSCGFEIERVTFDSSHKSDLFEPWVRFAPHPPEIDVWAAMSRDVVAGWAVATTVGTITNFGPAETAVAYRNRGIQTALIHARLKDAVRRGSEIAVSETLSMLGSSLRNLRRAGFTIAYDKIVYGWQEK